MTTRSTLPDAEGLEWRKRTKGRCDVLHLSAQPGFHVGHGQAVIVAQWYDLRLETRKARVRSLPAIARDKQRSRDCHANLRYQEPLIPTEPLDWLGRKPRRRRNKLENVQHKKRCVWLTWLQSHLDYTMDFLPLSCGQREAPEAASFFLSAQFRPHWPSLTKESHNDPHQQTRQWHFWSLAATSGTWTWYPRHLELE